MASNNVLGKSGLKLDPGSPEALRNGCLCKPTAQQPANPTQGALARFQWLSEDFLVNVRCPMHTWR